MGYTGLQIVTNALLEAGIVPAGQTVSGNDADWGLQKFNDLLDEWAARSVYAYTTNFNLYTLVPGLSPHTIGPSAATFNVAQVPVRVESCALRLSLGGTGVDIPMRIRDSAWWAAQAVKSIQTNVPTDLYYDANQPNGNLFFWPVPNAAQSVLLETWVILSQLAKLSDTVILPPGYRQAFTLTLAEMLCPSFNREPSPTLVKNAILARKAIQANNAKSPRIATQDAGMPSSGLRGKRSTFNYLTGNLT